MTPDRPRRGNVRSVFVATAVAGVFGYAIQAIAAGGLPASSYAAFSVFWAATFLLVGSVSGVQQETARATRPASSTSEAGRRLGVFTLIAAGAAAAIVALSSPLWAPAAFPTSPWSAMGLLSMVAPTAVGTAIASGLLYGTGSWRPLSIIIVLDPVLRLALLLLALHSGRTDLLPWAIVLPIPITLAAAAVLAVRRLRHHVVVDVGARRLLLNSAQTVVGAAATAILISALPLFIGTWARADPAFVGALLFNMTVTRAPLVIPALAFQSLLILYFRDAGDRLWRRLGVLLASIASAAVILAVAAGLAGPPVVRLVIGSDYVIDGVLLGALVAAAGLTAMLCVTGATVVAYNGHGAFALGWIIAAASALILLAASPLDLGTRVVLSLSVGPTMGLATHIVFLVLASASRARRSRGSRSEQGKPRTVWQDGPS